MIRKKLCFMGMVMLMTASLFTACGDDKQKDNAASNNAASPDNTMEAADNHTEFMEKETDASEFEYEEIDGKIKITHYIGESMEVSIPAQIDGKDVTAIGDYCCRNSDLTTVVCPNTLETIGAHAFSNCGKLTSIELNDGLQSIGESAFFYCESLSFIRIPDSVTLFGEESFSRAGLTSMEYLASAEELPRSCFAGTQMKEITISGKVKKIELSALANSKELEKVMIEDGVESIGKIAIAGCPKLTSITIPASVTEIAEKAFSDNSAELVLTVEPGSYAEAYAKENKLAYVNP
ncbi:MAG: leucine-rich repeat domain-containing protein [Lachnoclostridium sp.]|nr:leucine-rich repeat domain-containing protein [Lachnospira sp.]MCM1248056.1 leucine-rich repeat domain-containing protein [Lachnoclostridium sp.]